MRNFDAVCKTKNFAGQCVPEFVMNGFTIREQRLNFLRG